MSKAITYGQLQNSLGRIQEQAAELALATAEAIEEAATPADEDEVLALFEISDYESEAGDISSAATEDEVLALFGW